MHLFMLSLRIGSLPSLFFFKSHHSPLKMFPWLIFPFGCRTPCTGPGAERGGGGQFFLGGGGGWGERFPF